MANFIVNIAEGAYDDVKAALAAVGAELAPVEVTVVSDVKAGLSTAEALIERNGGQLLISEALAALDGLVTGNWSAVVATLIANAKAAGATTIASEEQLAGSTALQIAQVVKTLQVPPTVTPDAPAA